MSAVHDPPPSWADFAVRAVIYAGVAGLAFWWHPMLGLIIGLFACIDLLHHAADTTRRRAGYVPIPRHPSMPGAPKGPLKRTPRALLTIFAITWLTALLIDKLLVGQGWSIEVILHTFGLAAFVTVVAFAFFPLAVVALLKVMSVTLGLLLSLADLLALFISAPDARNAWHRAVDAADHRLADLVLGQDAMIPLRADLAQRAAEDARAAKGQT